MKQTEFQAPPDMDTMRICELKGLTPLGFARSKMNEWSDEGIDNLKVIAGSTLVFTAIIQSRFPIVGLNVLVESDSLDFTALPVKSVAFPEKAQLLPDFVSPEPGIDVPGNTTMMFLIKASVPTAMRPGKQTITLRALSESHTSIERKVSLEILPAVNTVRHWDTNTIFWPHWKTLCVFYDLELWSEEFWTMADSYLEELAKSGQNGIMVTLKDDAFQYPMPKNYYYHHDKPSPIRWYKDGDTWEFDYELYDRYIELHMKHGIDKEIECHSLLPCKCQEPILRYYDRQAGKNVAVPTTFDAPEYREAWQSFLRDFVKHNKEKGWDKLLILCPYDEPTDPETFRRTANMAKEVAPDIRITAAIQAKVANELTDVLDIATLHLKTGYDREKRDELRNAGVELRWYNCCHPDWGNTLFCCELAESYQTAWITFANDFNGYLRWSFADFTKDVFTNPGFNWPTGDMYLLYPGAKGPLPSLRWEALKTGVEDVKLLAGVINDPDTSEEKRDKLWELARRIGKDEAISPPNDILVWRNELFEIIAL
jgi:Glycoside hydrolase 123, catalytic domain